MQRDLVNFLLLYSHFAGKLALPDVKQLFYVNLFSHLCLLLVLEGGGGLPLIFVVKLII